MCRSRSSGRSDAASRRAPEPCSTRLRVSAGSSFAAFGAGAVGLSAVMAARVAGATTIVAVDVVPERLSPRARDRSDACRRTVASEDPVAAIHAAHGRRRRLFDRVHGSGRTSPRKPSQPSAPRGVPARSSALPLLGTELVCDINDVMQNGKTIRGVVEGDSVPAFFIPQLIDLYLQGRFPFDRLTRVYEFDAIDEAAADSEEGRTIKPIVRMLA